MAARRRCPDRVGHDAPEHDIITPAPARTQPRLHFRISPSPSSLATPVAVAPLAAIAVASHRLA